MTFPDCLFLDHLPTLDLHGLDEMSAKLMIKDFIRDNKKMKEPIFVIIHGIGKGILKRATKEVLEKDKNVLDYKVSNFNSGYTIVRIKN